VSDEHALTEAQKQVVEEVRNYLRSIHQIETSYLHDTAITYSYRSHKGHHEWEGDTTCSNNKGVNYL